MQYQFTREDFHNGHEWRRFFMLWLTIFLWGAFLAYMLIFHFQRELMEPFIMNHFNVANSSLYLFIEIRLFTYLFMACCIISILSIMNTLAKRKRSDDKVPDKYLIVIMSVTVLFAIYYAKTDLSYLNGKLSFISTIFGQ